MEREIRGYSYWKNYKNVNILLESIGKEIGIKKLEDWYKVTKKQIYKHGGNK